jgi:hypothetical protein
MKYDRTVIAYHGCDSTVAEEVLNGGSFKKSVNDYDWLGEGIYFWEYGADRALRFAEEQKRRKKIKSAAVVGALVQLGRCFDLMDTRFTSELRVAYEALKRLRDGEGLALPKNGGAGPDKKLRHLDCAVLNFYLGTLEASGQPYDTVRCGFVEGAPAYEGSGIHEQSHVQLSVRSPGCIVGVFRPTMFEAP